MLCLPLSSFFKSKSVLVIGGQFQNLQYHYCIGSFSAIMKTLGIVQFI